MATTTFTHAQTIASITMPTIRLGEALCKDIPAEQFSRFVEKDGEPIQANHPGFLIGHLAIYPPRIAGMLGLDEGALGIDVPESWHELFKNGAECLDDPDGSIYPAKDELVGVFLKGYSALAEAVQSVDDSVLAAENPIESMRERFPTVGTMVTFMCTSHAMLHLGQISTWRRCVGLGPAM